MKYEKGPSEQPDRPERSPEQMLSLAAAIADRRVRDRLLGEGKNPDTDVSAVDKAIARGHASTLLQRFEDPDAPVDIQTAIGWYDNPEVAEELYQQQLKYGDINDIPFLQARPEETKKFLLDAFKSQFDEALNIEGNEEIILRSTERYLTLLPALEETAERHQLPIETVLRNDDLYAETIRHAYTLEEYINFENEGIEQTISDYITVGMKTIGRIREAELGRKLSDEEVVAYLNQQLQRPDFSRFYNAALEKQWQTSFQEGRQRVQRYWPAEQLQALPPELQHWLET